MPYDTYKPEWAPDQDDQDSDKFACRVMTGVEDPYANVQNSDAVKKPPKLTIDDYVEGILAGNRMVLSRAITKVESNASKHFEIGQEIVQRILPYTGKAIRVGITGVPGAGKSTFIEALGTRLCTSGKKVAVLAVDPSSSLSHGSILGDKTRMEQLSRDKNAFIRPSPSGGTLGGVTRKSRETLLLCEAAGYEVILVETVGVGQSETTVRSMVDFFLTVVITGAGDDLQGLKKGILELADAIIVNKADGANKQKALVTRADYEQILHYIRPATEGWRTQAFTCSSLTGEGVWEIWDVVTAFVEQMRISGLLQHRRQEQNLTWVKEMVDQYIRTLLLQNHQIAGKITDTENSVAKGEMTPTAALRQIIAEIDEAFVK